MDIEDIFNNLSARKSMRAKKGIRIVEGENYAPRLYVPDMGGKRVSIIGGKIIEVKSGGVKVNNQGFVSLGKMSGEEIEALKALLR